MRVYAFTFAWRAKILAPCVLNTECSFAYCTDSREARKIQRGEMEERGGREEGNARI